MIVTYKYNSQSLSIPYVNTITTFFIVISCYFNKIGF